MFTLQQIKDAHSRAKTGADFPRYIQDIRSLGLKRYEFMVSDGDTVYYSNNGHKVQSGPRYKATEINCPSSIPALKHAIAIHQKGETDFPAFCIQAAAAGVEKWVIDTEKMLCIYYGLEGREMAAEPIPQGEYV